MTCSLCFNVTHSPTLTVPFEDRVETGLLRGESIDFSSWVYSSSFQSASSKLLALRCLKVNCHRRFYFLDTDDQASSFKFSSLSCRHTIYTECCHTLKATHMLNNIYFSELYINPNFSNFLNVKRISGCVQISGAKPVGAEDKRMSEKWPLASRSSQGSSDCRKQNFFSHLDSQNAQMRFIIFPFLSSLAFQSPPKQTLFYLRTADQVCGLCSSRHDA